MKHATIAAALLGTVALAGCFYPPEPVAADACGAGANAGLVGAALPKGFAPPPPARVFRTGDALTMDFVAHRLNVEVDRKTGKVVQVFCG